MKSHKDLFSRLVTFENLLLAAKKSSRGKKSKKSVAGFVFGLEKEIIWLLEELTENKYAPRPYNVFEIREPKPRQICSSYFRDRVVHHAICNILEPIFERRFIFDSYACRKEKGSHKALKKCQLYTRKYKYFLKCDIRKYFDSVDHEILKQFLQKLIKDQKFLNLLAIIIDHQVPYAVQGKGIPIGNLTSQYFANFYLDRLDHYMKDTLAVGGYIRYMDDFITFSDSKEELQIFLEKIRSFVGSNLKLELKEKVTKIAPVTDGVPFLGFRIFPNLIRLQRANLVRFRKKMKSLDKGYSVGYISEDKYVTTVQSVLGHVYHGNTFTLRKELSKKSIKA